MPLSSFKIHVSYFFYQLQGITLVRMECMYLGTGCVMAVLTVVMFLG